MILFYHNTSSISTRNVPRPQVCGRSQMGGAWWSSVNSYMGNSFGVTRTTGHTHSNEVYVDESGYMFNRGILVTCKDAAIIPALVLGLNSTLYEYAGTYTKEQ